MLCLEKRTERSWDHRIIGTRDFQIIRADKAKEIPIPSPRQQEVDPHVFAEAGDNDERNDINIFISHRWEADNHPDPTGRQWKAVLSLIDAICLFGYIIIEERR